MAPFFTLLSPRWLSLRNTVLRGERRRLYMGLFVIGTGFWLGLFVLLVDLLQRFWGIEGVGPFLLRKLLEMLLASLFVMLTFSNVITALSTYFLAEDLELLLAMPVQRPTFHYARFLDTLLQSGWMMGLFGVPVFMAYGYVVNADWRYYASLLVAIPALLIIASAIGVILATTLVNTFPARRTRELMVLVGVLMTGALFVLFRSLRPERLFNTSEFDSLAAYLAEVQMPTPAMFPPRWASDLLTATLMFSPVPWQDVGLLVTGAVASAAVGRWVTTWGFDTGWARAQEARAARFYRSVWFDRITALLPLEWRAVVAKELRVFFRDPSQWSQIFLLMSLCAVYLVSIEALPVDAFQGELGQRLRQALSFLNLGMGGFVMAAIAARFQFTTISREGRAWWLIRSAPIEPVTFLWAKSLPGFFPMLVVGEVVTVGSGWLLGAGGWLILLEGVTSFFLCFGISGIAVSFGALWPDFKAENTARAAGGPAAVLFMVAALVLVGVVLALEVIAVLAVTWGHAAWVAVIPLLLAAGLCLFLGIWPIRSAARVLWARGL